MGRSAAANVSPQSSRLSRLDGLSFWALRVRQGKSREVKSPLKSSQRAGRGDAVRQTLFLFFVFFVFVCHLLGRE
jgi:hypothetical protein